MLELFSRVSFDKFNRMLFNLDEFSGTISDDFFRMKLLRIFDNVDCFFDDFFDDFKNFDIRS